MQEQVVYDFKAETPDRYVLLFEMESKAAVVNMVFAKSKAALREKQGINVEGKPEDVTQFDVPPQYLNVIRTFLHRFVRKVEREVKADKIRLLNDRVTHARFMRQNNGNWQIVVTVKGNYVDER